MIQYICQNLVSICELGDVCLLFIPASVNFDRRRNMLVGIAVLSSIANNKALLGDPLSFFPLLALVTVQLLKICVRHRTSG